MKTNYKELIKTIGFSPKNGTTNIYYKEYKNHNNYIINIDFSKEKIDYGKLIKFDSATTQNFSKDENFVVLECVNRLLEKGYKPQNIILEKTWAAGHGKSGALDICVTRKDQSEYLLIECKTYGKEFDKAVDKINKDGGQLFTYFKFSNKADVIMLYASELQKNEIVYKNEIIKIEDDYRIGDVKDFYDKWNKLTKDNGIFEYWVKPYCFENKALIKSQLKPINQEDSSFIFNQFLEILRHNVVSDKGNAFNKIFTLFLCKVYDETSKQEDEELDFQWKEGIDDDISFQLRLTELYKSGMLKFLSRTVSDFNKKEFDNKYKDLSQETKDELLKEINILRLEKNNEFAIKEVYDHDSFIENAKIVKEVVELLQSYRIRYNKRQQYLSDFFELLLTTGLKQEAGQFFTPVPIAQFIIRSLPLEKIVDSKLKSKTGELLPYMIDYASGSGHFITEYMHEVQNIINKKEPSKFIDSTSRKIKNWQLDQYDWATDYVYGIEKDYRLVKVGKVGCYLHGDGLANVILSDGLGNFANTKDYKGILKKNINDNLKDNQQFDIILSNPPYSVSSFKQTTRDFYTEKDFDLYNNLTDNSSEIECLFVERTKQLLKDGGIAGIILPSSILTNTGIYTKTRELLLKYFEIIAITELGANTFMATGTNTVILFLKRKNNYDCINLQKSIDKFFTNYTDLTINNVEKPITKYVNYIWNNLTFNDYVTLLKQTPNEKVKSHDIFKEYSQKIKAKNEKEFFNKLIEIEKEKLYYFILTYNQKVVIIKTGEKEAEKQFLGYEFSNRRGSEGIHAIQRSKTIDECTKLFDIDSFDNPQKASTYIYKAFNGDFETEIDDSLKENISRVNLTDLINFETNFSKTKADFEKIINIKSKKKVKISTKYKLAKLEGLLIYCNLGVTYDKRDISLNKTNNIVLTADNITLDNRLEIKKEIFLNNNINLSKDKKLKTNDIFMCFSSGSIDHIGKFAYIEKDLPYYAGGFMGILRSDESKLLSKYLYYILQFNGVRENIKIFATGNNINNLSSSIKNLEIPLPPLVIQQKIIDENEKFEKISLDSSKTIDNNYNDILRIMNSFKQKQEKLDEFIILNEEARNPKSLTEKYFTYVDIDAVENSTGKICFDKRVESQKAPSRARRIAKSKSILISTVRPYLKAFAYIENELENTIYSTGFAIIRSNNENILMSKYLYYLFMYNENLMEQMKAAMPKGQYPSINDKDIRNFTVPILPLKEQQKIVSQIEKLEKHILDAQKIIDNSKLEKQKILDKYLK